MGKLYEQKDVTCVASVITCVDAFMSTSKVPRTLLEIWSLHKTANDDVIVYDERDMIADVPADMLPSLDDKLVFNRKITDGHTVRVGFREGNAATPTGQIVIVSEIPD